VPTMTMLESCCSTTRVGLAAVTAGPTSCSKAMDDAAAARARSTMTNSPRAYHVCVLDRCAGLLTMAEEGQGTDNDADQGHEQAPEGRPTSLIASQQGMGSLDRRCLIERHADQRFRWSEAMWSPPPESNRRPHPYHVSPAHRHATLRFPRSRSSVTGTVMGWLSGSDQASNRSVPRLLLPHALPVEEELLRGVFC
jgi:hypothetical protein